MSIVPDISDQAEQNGIGNWETSSMEEYKIRVLNPRDAKMTKRILDTARLDCSSGLISS